VSLHPSLQVGLPYPPQAPDADRGEVPLLDQAVHGEAADAEKGRYLLGRVDQGLSDSVPLPGGPTARPLSIGRP